MSDAKDDNVVSMKQPFRDAGLAQQKYRRKNQRPKPRKKPTAPSSLSAAAQTPVTADIAAEIPTGPATKSDNVPNDMVRARESTQNDIAERNNVDVRSDEFRTISRGGSGPREPALPRPDRVPARSDTWLWWRQRGGGGNGPGAGAVDTVRMRRTARRSFLMTLLAVAFCGLGIAINIASNRTATGDTLDYYIPIALGILAELAVFLIPSRMMVLSLGLKVVGLVVLIAVVMFAAMNSLKNASNTLSDQTMARGDRTTPGVQTADRRLAEARQSRDRACRSGQGKAQACRLAQADVQRLEAAVPQAEARVATTAKSADADFTRLVTWTSGGFIRPDADAFSNLWLLFRTVLPLIGGVLLAMARPVQVRA
jgi:hypothetical protein